MADKKQKSEPEFIRGTVLASILLLLIFIGRVWYSPAIRTR